ncbi:MAG: hypothetical protein LUG99_07155 [Lachnospiraceae bacterium]|nr:hypothetical protein [Lachnospiraceae bacterium]
MFQIDPEFVDKIPPLTEEEYQQLEENIVSEGVVLNPLVIWNNLIIDGHNRYKIIQKHPEVSYSVYEKEFPDRYAAIAWICKNQLGRRNLTPQQKKYLIGERYEAEKMAHGGDRKSEDRSRGQNDLLISEESGSNATRKQIAVETHTSDSYVKRAGQYAKGVNAAEEAVPGIKQEILTGRIKPTEAAVSAVAKAPPAVRREMAEQLRKPRDKPSAQVPEESPDESDDDTSGCDTDIDPVEPSPKRNWSRDIAFMRRIGDEMATSTAVMTVEDVLYELEDAAETLIDRWDLCMEQNPSLIIKEECRTGIQRLIATTINYLKNVRGGLSQ